MKLKVFNGSEVFFTSDTHFDHEAIIWLCNRPFTCVEEMNAKLIENWNATVGPGDTVFHLGDFSMKGTQRILHIREYLNGKIHLILGNHDIPKINLASPIQDVFESITEQQSIMIDGIKIILNHYPFLCFPGQYNPHMWQLFGHVHTRENNTGCDRDRLKYLFPTQYDVGVDNNDYRPVSWAVVKEKIEKQIAEYDKERKAGKCD